MNNYIKYTACILYKPMKDEVDFNEPSFPIEIPHNKIILSQNPKIDAFVEAKNCTLKFEGENVFVLVPGREFDLKGNRKGRGGGWYDRFLSKIPENWIKIGVLYEKDLNKETLLTNPWDQKMDVLVVRNENGWSVKNI
jgi:5-formyltetrahydrofolate cyclo-ligase